MHLGLTVEARKKGLSVAQVGPTSKPRSRHRVLRSARRKLFVGFTRDNVASRAGVDVQLVPYSFAN